jgi:hypothetical protein
MKAPTAPHAVATRRERGRGKERRGRAASRERPLLNTAKDSPQYLRILKEHPHKSPHSVTTETQDAAVYGSIARRRGISITLAGPFLIWRTSTWFVSSKRFPKMFMMILCWRSARGGCVDFLTVPLAGADFLRLIVMLFMDVFLAWRPPHKYIPHSGRRHKASQFDVVFALLVRRRRAFM